MQAGREPVSLTSGVFFLFFFFLFCPAIGIRMVEVELVELRVDLKSANCFRISY